MGDNYAACGVRRAATQCQGGSAGSEVLQVNVTLGLAQLQDCRTARPQDRRTMYYSRRAATRRQGVTAWGVGRASGRISVNAVMR
jgi:hypothetical protein